MAACCARSNCVLYLVEVSTVVISQSILCPVVRVNVGQEQICCGSCHEDCLSEVLSGIHVI